MKQFSVIISLLITISIFAQPANNDCSNAIALTLQNSNNINYTTGNLGNATQTSPACSGSTSTDVWYQFTATTKANKIYLPPQTGLDLAFEIFDACGGNSIACVDNNSTSVSENYYDYHFTIGQTYYIKVFLYNQSFNDAPFEIAVISMSQPNDECTDSINIPVQGTDNPTSVQGNLGGATESLSPCTGNFATDVWFKFTAINSNENIFVSAESYFNPVIEVFDACGGNSIACVNNNGVNFSEAFYGNNFTPGNQYFIRVFGYNQFFEDRTFNITVTDPDNTSSTNDFTKDNVVSIYPNPTSDKLNIKTENKSFNYLQILTIRGIIVLEKSIKNNTTINVSKLNQGVYFVKFYNKTDSNKVIKRLIIE